MNSLINKLSNETLLKGIVLSPDLVITGAKSDIESLVLVQIIAIAEELLEDSGVEKDLFALIFSSAESLTLSDLQVIIDSALTGNE